MAADPNAKEKFQRSQTTSYSSVDASINPDFKAKNTPAVLRSETQDAKDIVKGSIEKDLNSEYGNEFDVQQPYGNEFDVQGTEVINNEKIEHSKQPPQSEQGSSNSTEGDGDSKPLSPGGLAPGQAKAEPNTYVDGTKPSKKSGLTRYDGTSVSGSSGSHSSDLALIFCNSSITYAKDQKVIYSNTTGGGSGSGAGKSSAEALGNNLNTASEESLPEIVEGSGPYTAEDFPNMTPKQAQRTADQINSMDPSVQGSFAGAIKEYNSTYASDGEFLTVTEGYRTPERSNMLRAQGIKAAPGGYSWHNYGMAGDVAIITNGGKTANWDSTAYYNKVKPIMNKYGLNNPVSNDSVHFQPTRLSKSVPASVRNKTVTASSLLG